MGQQQPIIQGNEGKMIALEMVKKNGFIADMEAELANLTPVAEMTPAANPVATTPATTPVSNTPEIQTVPTVNEMEQTSQLQQVPSAADLVADSPTNKDLLAQQFAPQPMPQAPVVTEVLPAAPAQFAATQSDSTLNNNTQDKEMLSETLNKALTTIEQMESSIASLKGFISESMTFAQNNNIAVNNSESYQATPDIIAQPQVATPAEDFAPFAPPTAGEVNMFDEPAATTPIQNNQVSVPPVQQMAPNPSEQLSGGVIPFPANSNQQPGSESMGMTNMNNQPNNITQFPMNNQQMQANTYANPEMANNGGFSRTA